MIKILKLIGILTLSSIVTSPILACSNETVTDGILKIIRAGDSDYEAWNLKNNIGINNPGIPTINHFPKAKQEITNDNLKVLAQTLAQMILEKAENKDVITWFTPNLSSGTKCYNFVIDNGTVDSTSNSKTWDVNETTARIAIDITYQMGEVKDNNFISKQSVKNTFNLKCDYSQSEYMVYKTVKSISDIPNNNLKVNITDKDKPKIGSSFGDLSTNIKSLIQTELVKQTKISNPYVNSVAIIAKGITGEVLTDSYTIKITFNVQFQDSFVDMTKPSPYDGSMFPQTIIEFIIS